MHPFSLHILVAISLPLMPSIVVLMSMVGLFERLALSAADYNCVVCILIFDLHSYLSIVVILCPLYCDEKSFQYQEELSYCKLFITEGNC